VADDRPLFTSPVAEMTACGSTGTPSSRLRGVPLGHQLAVQLAQHLNSAGTTSDDPDLCLAGLNIAVLLAWDDHGRALPPVTLTPGCEQITAFNRSTTRYLALNDPAFQQAERYVGRVLRRASPTVPSTGVVVGVLRLSGGPAPGTSRAVTGQVYAFRDAALRGKPAAISKANSDGAFRLTLAPGTYYLAATSPQFEIHPKPKTPPCRGGPAVVRAADTTHVDVGCAMK
jgi:hypothetical protein